MKTRNFRPPATCGRCSQRPLLGETLLQNGGRWICGQCLLDEAAVVNGRVFEKLAIRSIAAERSTALSKRARAAGDIEVAQASSRNAARHQAAARAMFDRGAPQARSVKIVNSEVIPTEQGYLRDTLADPDIAAIESSVERGELLMGNDILALGVDVSNTVRAANTVEKLLSHEMALAHKIAMAQAKKAQNERDPHLELKRLQVSARMLTTAQQCALAIQKLKTGGSQSFVVQHVHVEAGGQAVVGNLQPRPQ